MRLNLRTIAAYDLRQLNFAVRLARFKFTRSRMRIKTNKGRKDRGTNELKF